jgi:hypothetical protein
MLFSYHTGYNETELYGNIHVGPGWRYTDKNVSGVLNHNLIFFSQAFSAKTNINEQYKHIDNRLI